MSNLSAMSPLSATHIKSLSSSGVREDLNFVHMQFMAENALSTLAVGVDKAFFALTSFIRFSVPLVLIVKPSEMSCFAFLTSVFNKVLFTLRQSKCSTRYRSFSVSKKCSDTALNAHKLLGCQHFFRQISL